MFPPAKQYLNNRVHISGNLLKASLLLPNTEQTQLMCVEHLKHLSDIS